MNYLDPMITHKVLEWQLAAKHAGVYGDIVDESTVMTIETMIETVDNAEAENILGQYSRDEALILMGIMTGRFYQSFISQDSAWDRMKKMKIKDLKFFGGEKWHSFGGEE